ncbi:Peptidoglycan-binding (PGRP) domain of peptidoglycan hydrolases-containing protein [Stigmatella erecta]|uniref:Peptidoglycan-binding (PGRP) domain of peptidoglycan hydrolases-containing protein n=2 Tax=Stigmatella erecta TaxID=83460 RepID=A0A1I0LDL3_9BACT|nr:Peptidoglycan-binding (PGRP) domain of peptidoglycan hydrolases-containing protein [Stigmatella erecta]
MSLSATQSQRTNSAYSSSTRGLTPDPVRSGTNPNAILSQYAPTGASAKTAKQDNLTPGVRASQKMAQTDLPQLRKYKAGIEAAAQKHGLPPALLAAIMSRETRGGTQLDKTGRGDRGNGFGLMQVDLRYHKAKGGPTSAEHIDQAAGILKGYVNDMKKAHPDWSEAQQLRGAVAAYNFGPGNVQTQQRMDVGTTGDDYSNDVWARAQALAPHFGGAVSTGNTQPRPSNTATPTRPAHTADTFEDAGAKKWTTAPALEQVQAGGHNLREGMQGPAVKQIQQMLGIPADGKYGPATKKAVAEFQRAQGLKPGTAEGQVGPTTLQALQTPGGTRETGTPGNTNTRGVVLGNGVRINTNDPSLKKLATSRLSNGETGYCVRTTLDNMSRLGIPNTPAATGNDRNNPRGGMAQMLRKGWESIPFPGSRQETIRSPYGNATANVVSADQYRKLVDQGMVPDGAIIFQTRHGWDYSGGSKGNDMGIVRNGGRTTHNYKDMNSIIYSDCKEVTILVPKGAIQRD